MGCADRQTLYIIYTPNLGFEIAVPGREREQGRFRGSSEGARGSTEGAQWEHWGAAREERFWLLGEPNLAASYSATTAPVIYPAVLPGSACCCLNSYSFAGSWFHLVPVKCFLTKAHRQGSLDGIPANFIIPWNKKSLAMYGQFLIHHICDCCAINLISNKFSMMIKLSARYSTKGFSHNDNSPSFFHDPVPPSVFANLSFNSFMTMKLNAFFIFAIFWPTQFRLRLKPAIYANPLIRRLIPCRLRCISARRWFLFRPYWNASSLESITSSWPLIGSVRIRFKAGAPHPAGDKANGAAKFYSASILSFTYNRLNVLSIWLWCSLTQRCWSLKSNSHKHFMTTRRFFLTKTKASFILKDS